VTGWSRAAVAFRVRYVQRKRKGEMAHRSAECHLTETPLR
jgi:hypothetical protein